MWAPQLWVQTHRGQEEQMQLSYCLDSDRQRLFPPPVNRLFLLVTLGVRFNFSLFRIFFYLCWVSMSVHVCSGD